MNHNRAIAGIERCCTLWERRKSRMQSSSIMARRDLRRSHNGISTGSAACA